jgi:transaldolase / glucose-6-phosphate isomerase
MSLSAKPSAAPKAGTENPLKELAKYGQSVWLDYIRRNLLSTGELARLIKEDGLRGVTSNPSIFEKAISGSTDYTQALEELRKSGLDAPAIYERLAVKDIQDAADLLRIVYDQTSRRDGYVSLEVSPYLANKTDETIGEARRLWKELGRENVMIKVPGTAAGIPAVRQLISEGINVNVTLLFAQEVYEKVAEAYISGLEEFSRRGGDLRRMASVASFFISRIDTLIDSQLAARIRAAKTPAEQSLLRSLQGKVAIANGKVTYEKYKQIFSGPRWSELAGRGAHTQRVLWASTSTKNPAYSDVLYVEELIGPDTVDTIPPVTLDAFRDHGHARPTLEQGVEAARETLSKLAQSGISLQAATDQLTEEGVKLFAEAFDKLLEAVGKRSAKNVPPPVDNLTYTLPGDLSAAVKSTLEDWKSHDKVKRLWARDASLWTNEDEGKWLGWLGVTEHQISEREQFRKLADEIASAGFRHCVLLGMGGSSLCVEVLQLTFGEIAPQPQILVLDSTDPAQIAAIERQIDIHRTLFIVSSKSGSTLEPNIFKQYFFDRVARVVGAAEAAQRFIAITDPGSPLEQVAQTDGFRHVFFGLPSIGGRYSALSNFGIVPGAIQGVEVGKLLDCTEEMVHACASVVPAHENPGVILGAVLGSLQKLGRDKVTILASPGIADLGAWLEQLLAESTGKQGKGLIPVDREQVGAPEVYGKDRIFVHLRLESETDSRNQLALDLLAKAGQPVVRIVVPSVYHLGQEFFRWEIATAVAGSIIGINAFNQPDVEASKVETRTLTSAYEKTGSLPPESPFFEDPQVKLFADDRNAAELKKGANREATLAGFLRAHLGRIGAGDYFALLAYVQMNELHRSPLQSIRHLVRDKKRVATCLGFGPRFLHSTGQAYKGGPNSGVFLQITCDDASDLKVPGQKYTFGIVKAAQARGDFEVLAGRGRRVLRAHVGSDVSAGLAKIEQAVRQALQ